MIRDLGVFSLLLGILFTIFFLTNFKKSKKNNKSIRTILLVLIVSLGVTIVGCSASGGGNEAEKAPDETSSIEEAKKDQEAAKEDDEAARKKEEEAKRKEAEEKKEKEQARKKEEKRKEEIAKKEEERSFEEVHNLKVHYLNVGQGDSILIELPNNEIMLIDGGTRGNGSVIENYLKNLQIDKIDYLVATHPHEDHIGGLIQVINGSNIGKIYMPNVTHTTKTFEDLLLAIKGKGKKIINPSSGDMILDKEGLRLKVVAPESSLSGNNLNNYSVVVKLDYKDNSFIFTGDAEKEAESKMVSRGENLKADVLKVGHHGSDTSTTDSFLNKVDPKYAVISCGIDNTYNHPNDETINKLNVKGITIFRTDLDGTIIATSDGKEITFNKKGNTVAADKETSKKAETSKKPETKKKTKSSKKPETSKKEEEVKKEPEISKKKEEKSGGNNSQVKPPETDNVEEVYITNTGGKYHRGSCRYLKKSKIAISLKKAKENYGPCKVCKP